MRKENRALLPVHPQGLQLISRKNQVRTGQLRFFPGIDRLLSAGKNVLSGLIGAASAGDKNAHIQAQNQAGADMDAIVKAYTQIKNQGLLTSDHIDQAQSAMRQVIDNFKQFAQQVGTTRAQAGAADIEYYGNIAIRDMESDRTLTGGIPTIPGGIAPLPRISLPAITSTATQMLPWIAIGIFLFALPKIGKRDRG